MNEMFFLSSWPELDRAWSGTPMGLYTALNRKIKLHLLQCAKEGGKVENILNSLTMGLATVGSFQKCLNNANMPEDAPVFVFGEYHSRHIKNTYCYQDLSVDYSVRMRQENHPAAGHILHPAIPTWIAKKKCKQAQAFYQNCAGIFTMSEWLRQDLITNSGIPAEKVHHVGGGSNIDVSKIDSQHKQGNCFLFVGIDWERKNGELVVSAFKKLISANPDCGAQLYIAGPATQPQSTVGCENIHFLGRLTREELTGYYNKCDYYVMPSKFEAYGLVFAEALCFGMPCIGKNVYAMPEFIQHGTNGLLVTSDQVDELTGAMQEMLIHGPDMARYVQQNKAFYIAKYSWDSVAERIIQILERDGFFKSGIPVSD